MKSGLRIKILIAGACFCLVLIVLYLSALGINNRVHNNVRNFIQNISAKNYSEVLHLYSDEAITAHDSLDESMKFHFILELAMLEYFGLMESPDYSIHVKRENMWIPFTDSEELTVSVNLVPKEEAPLLPTFDKKDEQKPLDEFITLVREGGMWKIKKINIEGSAIESIFRKLQSDIVLDKYVRITPKGFILREAKFDLEKISPLEKKIIVHNLQTALETIGK